MKKSQTDQFPISYESGVLTANKFKEITENNSFLNPCANDLTHFFDSLTAQQTVTYRKFKNTGNHNLFLITIMGGLPVLAGCGIRKEDNAIIGGDDTYMAYPPDYIPCLIKLIPNAEYYLFENEAMGPRQDMYHIVFKIYYFDTKDSSFVSGWIESQNKKYYNTEEEFIIEHKNLIDPDRYQEFITFREAHKKNEKRMLLDSTGQAEILRLIRCM
jgi:hypothetical protein